MAGMTLCFQAARDGDLKQLKIYHDPVESDTCEVAAMCGHLECLKYAHEHGSPWTAKTCEAAAMNNHLDCLVYAHENGCPWTVTTCQDASLDCLLYAREHGCPCTQQMYEQALAKG